MKIGSHDTDQRVLVIAEIGNNHEGDFALAQRLVRLAAEAGADAVKFQTIVPEELVTPDQTARLARLRQFQFSLEQFATLARVAHEAGVLFLTSPFALDVVAPLTPHVDGFKIASGDNTFRPLLDAVAASGKPVIVSTGLLDLAGVQALHACLAPRLPAARLALLHCVTAYPAPDEQAGLAAIPVLARALPCTVGYSDHTLGIDAAALAVAAGARIIEKHFTLDKQYSDFRDHQLSADPADLRALVTRIRQAERFLGTAGKSLQPCEQAMVTPVRRSICARRDLPAGHRLAMADLAWLRPGDGLAPGHEAELLGKALRQAVTAGQRLTPDQVV
jgi:sialic acid synthase SpsE